MQYLFRKPKFPLLCDIEGELIVACSMGDFDQKLKAFKLKPDHLYSTIDASVEGWFLNVEPLTIAPLTLKKRWTRAGLIKLYNGSKNARRENDKYAEAALSTQPLSAVLGDIVALVQAADSD